MCLRACVCLSDVPQEAQVEPEEEPDEPNESSDQKTESKPSLDLPEHVQLAEPVPLEPVELAQPVEPIPTAAAAAAATSGIVSPDLGYELEPDEAVPQEEADQPDLQIGGSQQKHEKEKMEDEDEVEEEQEREALEGGEAPHVDKGETCEDRAGLNPQQVYKLKN